MTDNLVTPSDQSIRSGWASDMLAGRVPDVPADEKDAAALLSDALRRRCRGCGAGYLRIDNVMHRTQPSPQANRTSDGTVPDMGYVSQDGSLYAVVVTRSAMTPTPGARHALRVSLG